MLTRLTRAREQGFTLIELVVVVLIIGILTAIAVPIYVNQQNKGKEATVKSDITNAVPGIDQAYLRDGKYPTDQRYTSRPDPSQTTFRTFTRLSAGTTLDYYVYADENDFTKTFYGTTTKADANAHPAFCIDGYHNNLGTSKKWRYLSTERTVVSGSCPTKIIESSPAP